MKKTTIHDIAAELGVTFSTVARALNDHPAISAATKAAVLETARRLNYQQNKLASSLRSGRSNVIGIIVPSLDTSFFSSVVHGMERVLNENGYSVLLYQTGESQVQEQKGVNTFLQSRVDGVLASVSAEKDQTEFYASLRKRQVPLLFFDRAIQELAIPSVTINDFQGGFAATEHLIQQGYQNIVHIMSDLHLTIFKERLRGYVEALKQHGLPVREELIFKGRVSLELGQQTVQQLLETQTPFDAIFAAEDYTAMGALQTLQERGVPVPEKVGIIGFANEAFGAFVTPSLSTVDQQTVKMGEETARLFLQLSGQKNFYQETPERIVLDPILVPRKSSTRGVNQ
ncbi:MULTISPECIES: LacI family DNA-binding transcriptional regulator [Rufibacter]|uniref:LacI family transcriptional regulator n=1 Tax=Rufibacter quisquiliarum TaxID=1549639 RepID=A0A839GE95_9BACT|nr:LacI family DNA-binding transcriptional regulator [Rufibacter ruber]MBA9077242.1 LacI family transcriptional regulator [Rufibacter quisquiliarum]